MYTVHEQAEQLLTQMGFSVIPVLPRSKKPAVGWKEFQTRLPDSDELKRWFEGKASMNVGVVTGAISGIVVVDFDSAEAVEWGLVFLPPTPLRSMTPRGQHWFYAHSGSPTPNTSSRTLQIDVRGDGGYVLVPPSFGENGTQYRWMTSDGACPKPLPVMTADMHALIRQGQAPAPVEVTDLFSEES